MTVSTPHPKDLEIASSPPIIVEAKVIGARPTLFAVREATAQLLMYRYFDGPRDARLCVLLDAPVDQTLIEYVEQHLGMMVAWWENGGVRGGPVASDVLGLPRSD